MTVYAITLCFNKPSVVEASLRRFYATKNPSLEVRHVLVDQCYPMPSRSAVTAKLMALAAEFNCILIHPGRNMGLHHGWNWAMNQLPLQPEDILIGYDPDSNPISHGWDMALATALSDPKVGWASLMNTRCEPELRERGFTERMIQHVQVWRAHRPVVNSICAWRASFLLAAGGLQEPTNYYGHLEAAMWAHLEKQGLEWVFLPGWRENDELRNMADREYLLYKWSHAHLGSWPGDFESFLAAGCPIPKE